MTQKEALLEAWDREFKTTLKVLNAYPQNQSEFKPHERSRSAKELAWAFVIEGKALAEGLNTGQVDFRNLPSPPATFPEVLSTYEKTHRELEGRIKGLSDKDLEKMIKFPVGPKQMGDVPCGSLINMLLMDQVHHRGQFSVYLRMAGGKVPSIYGPSADEPWM
jgi:uncharacterized damage-inducible protein DinB